MLLLSVGVVAGSGCAQGVLSWSQVSQQGFPRYVRLVSHPVSVALHVAQQCGSARCVDRLDRATYSSVRTHSCREERGNLSNLSNLSVITTCHPRL